MQEILIAGAGTKITFDSIHKLIFATMSMALLSYCAVSPRSLPFPEYNRLFLQNLTIVGIGAAIAPIVLFLGAFDGRHNNINSAVSQILDGAHPVIFAADWFHSSISLFHNVIDWDLSCFLHIGVRFSIRFGNFCYHGSSVGSVHGLGAANILFNSQGTVNNIAVGIAREALQAKENNFVCCRLWCKLYS
jgi:hypothetical protein